MDSVKKHSEAFFWEIATPVMVVITIAFTFSDLRRLFHYLTKRKVQQELKTLVKSH
ncbi:hypothetical protein FRC02_004254 [Tulasnella sp. 418]|nr:hypothetical protein FRC02_004254 [Tulasnella sp. 418]